MKHNVVADVSPPPPEKKNLSSFYSLDWQLCFQWEQQTWWKLSQSVLVVFQLLTDLFSLLFVFASPLHAFSRMS